MSKAIAMKKIKFDKNGLITPAEIVEINLNELQQVFVDGQPEEEHRRLIFAKYLEYNAAIKKRFGKISFQFVNGSFTTLKRKPNDIDVVSFLDYRIYIRMEDEIIEFSNQWNETSELDAYIVPRSYAGHPLFIQSQLAYDFWVALFTQTRKNELGEHFSKGLIKVNYYG